MPAICKEIFVRYLIRLVKLFSIHLQDFHVTFHAIFHTIFNKTNAIHHKILSEIFAKPCLLPQFITTKNFMILKRLLQKTNVFHAFFPYDFR